ncbi:MAG: ATP-binding protein [Acidimicrobiales bacterium]
MAGFVGRRRELASLDRELARVRSDPEQPGRCVMVRGRRRVGKSRLVEEFCTRAGVPHVFFAASRRGDAEVALFAGEVADSDLPGRDLFADANPATWEAAMRLLAAGVEGELPAIVVLDEFPYLVEDDPSLEATFQKLWDRVLSKKRILLILVGSDLAMMESLDDYDRAFHQRGTELVVPPLSPVEVRDITQLERAADAFDAYLITGGLPLVCVEWSAGMSMWEYLEAALNEQVSALVVSGERALAAEFPTDARARVVLEEIGSGERTFTNIARAAGGLTAASVTRSLDLLGTKRVVARDVPLSTSRSKEARYRVADPYLRFWLRFIGKHTGEIERARGDRILVRIKRDWTAWRGRAIEPVIREALMRMSPIEGLPAADAVGGFWTRSNNPEIDIIGADRAPVAKQIAYAGTIKWLDKSPLDQGDMSKLIGDLGAVAGADEHTPLVAISRSGATVTGAVVLGPEELIRAWG